MEEKEVISEKYKKVSEILKKETNELLDLIFEGYPTFKEAVLFCQDIDFEDRDDSLDELMNSKIIKAMLKQATNKVTC